MRSVLIFGALIGIFLIVNPNVNDAVTFRFTNFACESYNKYWVEFHNCRLKAISRSKVILNMNMTILHSTNYVQLHCKVFKKANGYKPWLFDKKFDVCRFQRHKNDPFLKLIFGLFEDFSNVNHSCPYVGPQIVNGLYLRPELLRLPLPTGDYLLFLKFFYDANPSMGLNVSFSFVEDLLKSK